MPTPATQTKTRLIRCSVAATLVGGLAVAAACGGDSTGVGGNCEIIFATSNPPSSSGIEVRNSTGGGLSVSVEGGGFFGTESDMSAGDCNVWAYPAGSYDVELRRCTQSSGSSACASFIGAAVPRAVTVQSGSRTVLNVDGSFFP